jgi:large subunit ribosomal protein L24
MKIRTHDEVVVIAGRDRGKRGRVLRVLADKNRVVIEGVNVVTRHLRRRTDNPQAGGRVQRPAAIHVSNVALWSAAENRGVRVRMKGEGREKVRVSAKTGEAVGGGAKGGKAAKGKAEKAEKAARPAKARAKAEKPAGD